MFFIWAGGGGETVTNVVSAIAAVRTGRGFIGGWGQGVAYVEVGAFPPATEDKKTEEFYHSWGLAGAGRYHPGDLVCG